MRDLSIRKPLTLTVAAGATSPVGLVGAEIWSTVENAVLTWDGTHWINLALKPVGDFIEARAGENLGAYKGVKVVNGMFYAIDFDILDDAGSYVGLTTASAAAGDLIKVQVRGSLMTPFTGALDKGGVFVYGRESEGNKGAIIFGGAITEPIFGAILIGLIEYNTGKVILTPPQVLYTIPPAGDGVKITALGGIPLLLSTLPIEYGGTGVTSLAELKEELNLAGWGSLLDVIGTSHSFINDNVNKYVRYTTAGAKTATFDSSEGFTAGDAFHITNRAASGNITISGIGVTFNPPKGGTRVLEPKDTVTVKFISPTEADVMGSTWAAAQIIQSLFAQGQQGFWLPFTDFDSLSQDSEGTLPYTALEQPVGKVLDISGRGNHATQPTSTARPKITQAVGQPKFLTFDGVDDLLQATLPTITGTWIVGYKEGTLVYKVNIPAGAFPIGTNSISTLWSPSKNFVGMVLRSGDLTEVEVSAVESYLVENGAGAAGVGAFAGVTNFSRAWSDCSSLTSFPLVNTSAGTIFRHAWYGCSSLTSFPLVNTSAGTIFYGAWYGCSSLTSFPLIDTSAGTNFYGAWYGCSSLTSFPLVNTSAGTNFSYAWYGCSSLTSFPLINTSAGTNFRHTWQGCSSLTSFPTNMFDSCPATDFTNAFQNCALSQASVDGILASLVTAGRTNGTVNMHGGTSATPSAAGLASKATLVSRGWTVTHN